MPLYFCLVIQSRPSHVVDKQFFFRVLSVGPVRSLTLFFVAHRVEIKIVRELGLTDGIEFRLFSIRVSILVLLTEPALVPIVAYRNGTILELWVLHSASKHRNSNIRKITCAINEWQFHQEYISLFVLLKLGSRMSTSFRLPHRNPNQKSD